MRLFLVKLALYYNADFHELEEIIHRSLVILSPRRLLSIEQIGDYCGSVWFDAIVPGAQLFNNTVTGTCPVQPAVKARISSGLAPIGKCEFVGELVAAGCDGRYCSDGTFCSHKIFADVKIFVGCPTRKDKLKAKQGT